MFANHHLLRSSRFTLRTHRENVIGAESHVLTELQNEMRCANGTMPVKMKSRSSAARMLPGDMFSTETMASVSIAAKTGANATASAKAPIASMRSMMRKFVPTATPAKRRANCAARASIARPKCFGFPSGTLTIKRRSGRSRTCRQPSASTTSSLPTWLRGASRVISVNRPKRPLNARNSTGITARQRRKPSRSSDRERCNPDPSQKSNVR